jgi:hypothetical protein
MLIRNKIKLLSVRGLYPFTCSPVHLVHVSACTSNPLQQFITRQPVPSCCKSNEQEILFCKALTNNQMITRTAMSAGHYHTRNDYNRYLLPKGPKETLFFCRFVNQNQRCKQHRGRQPGSYGKSRKVAFKN